MKVLHLFNEINFSGAEIMYANAAPLFQKEGVEMLAFSTGSNLGDFSSIFKQKNIKVYHKPIDFLPFSIKGIKYYLWLYNFLKQEKIDVLHIHKATLYFVAFIAWLANVTCIKTQHNTFRNRKLTLPIAIFRRFVLRKFLNVKFQTIGESVYNNELNYYKNPSFRVNNWFDDKKFYPPMNENEKKAIRNQLSISEGAYVLISSGSCIDTKNHKDIIRALPLIKDTIDVIYVHLGTGVLEEDEMELARELGVANLIKYVGNKENVRDYLIASDIFLMPSKFEGLGNSALEAMACQLPSILYNVAGLKDLIKEDDNGFLIDSNYMLLADKILEYYRNPEKSYKKGLNAFKHVKEHYSMEQGVSKMISLYNNNEN